MAFRIITGNQQLDFQINRVLTYGKLACDEEEVISAVKHVRDLQSWFKAWFVLAVKAESENRFLHAAYYYRMAEFYLSEKDADKNLMYERSVQNFKIIIDDDPSVEEQFIPYDGKRMKSLVFTPALQKQVIVMFGGYDSFIEEFYLAVKEVVEKGYKVILFEGPGQGLSLKSGLHFDHRWELPLGAVLDYYQLRDVNMVGISWGGYFALRAAAFDNRIQKVVAYDILFDGLDFMLKQFPLSLRFVFSMLLKFRQRYVINAMMRLLMNKKIGIDWALTHGMYITGTTSPYEYFNKLKLHTLKGLCHHIQADVLLLAGEKDHYIPLAHYHMLMNQLVKARSLTGHIFTEEVNGEQHCQVGNHQIAIEQIVKWIEDGK